VGGENVKIGCYPQGNSPAQPIPTLNDSTPAPGASAWAVRLGGANCGRWKCKNRMLPAGQQPGTTHSNAERQHPSAGSKRMGSAIGMGKQREVEM